MKSRNWCVFAPEVLFSRLAHMAIEPHGGRAPRSSSGGAEQPYGPISQQFVDYVGGAVTEWALGYPAAADALGVLRDADVLDVGCGGGNFAAFLADRGARVLGVDISAEMIALARSQHGQQAEFHLIRSADDLPSLGRSFDAAVATFVLCTMSSLDDIAALAQQVRGVLKDGGRFIVLHTNWERCNGAEFASFKLDRVPGLRSGMEVTLTLGHRGEGIAIRDNFWSMADYQSALVRAGFRAVRVAEVPPSGADPRFVDERIVSAFYLVSGTK
jgi:SAM-dependent methyltransferase